MFQGRILCKARFEKTSVENVVELLVKMASPGYKVWLYDSDVYAMFALDSYSSFTTFIQELRQRKFKFKILRVEEV